MEGVHGIDVSWLHHSHKDHHGQKGDSSAAAGHKRKTSQASTHSQPASTSTTAKTNGTHPSQDSLPRQHTPRRSSVEHGQSPQVSNPSKTSKDLKQSSSSRRNSWMSSLSSKFSSSSFAGGSNSEPASPPPAPKSPQQDQINPFDAAHSAGVNIVKSVDPLTATPPTSPKSGHGFLSGALRRLSSGGGTSMGKAAGTGGVCPRKTMNVDSHRDRCSISELEQTKLRRVAFCVDVEIAGAATYVDEESETSPVSPTPLEAESNLTKLQHQTEQKKKKKDLSLKKGEGEALKKPGLLVEEKENDGIIKSSGEDVRTEKTVESTAPCQAGINGSHKKEKKKRSEGERKERKEKKQQQAIANGILPAEIKRESSSETTTDSSHGAGVPSHSHDQPTTDPLRIYKRCCQLRETTILKRVAEQIASPSACPIATPGTLTCLDLSGYWIQMHDLITLGDYLAVVPVKKLIMEDCGLGDEGVRVVLAGLLAAKTPEQARYNRKLNKDDKAESAGSKEQIGVVEKLSLKNNPKIGEKGWRHIALFLYLSRSLKAIDLSMNRIPLAKAKVNSFPAQTGQDPAPTHSGPKVTSGQTNISTVLQEALGSRLAGSHLEELVMGECGMDTDCIGEVVNGVIKCGASRLGLASNNLNQEGFEHILKFVRSGVCEGLDIGGNDIHEYLDLLADTLEKGNRLFALSLAECGLLPESLERLFPALVKLENFRFIDLSHNRCLFASKPSALKLIRTYLPQFPILKRAHLLDVAMSPDHAIAIAEVLPESRSLAHLNILENHLLSPLADAKTEARQEEACAFYASLMAAVRVSESLVCVDIDVPSPDSSEVVKALAKQVVAYSLRNLERLPLAEAAENAKTAMVEPHGGDLQVSVPDVLLHLVGHVDGYPENHDHDAPAPDDDYIVGGTGVVKALDCLLNRANDGRKSSQEASPLPSGTASPRIIHEAEVSKGKAKDMSRNLLGSARKIRARLQPALVNEAKSGNELSYRRLQFLDSTLQRIIQRFEDEYPECRLKASKDDGLTLGTEAARTSSTPEDGALSSSAHLKNGLTASASFGEDEDENNGIIRPVSIPRRPSTPSLASKQAQEEGRMHRLGQRIRRDILRPETEDYAHGTTGTEIEAKHLTDLRRVLESFEGNEIKEKVDRLGPDAVLESISATADELAEWERTDPWKFDEVREIREKALAVYNEETSKARPTE